MEIYEVKEILSALKNTEDTQYAIEVFSSFIGAVSVCNQYLLLKTLKEQFEEFAEENNYCSDCLVPKEIYIWTEERNEGATETMNELRCPECGES